MPCNSLATSRRDAHVEGKRQTGPGGLPGHGEIHYAPEERRNPQGCFRAGEDICIFLPGAEELKVTRHSPYGFTKCQSWLTNLIAFYHKAAGFVGKGRAVDAIYLDFTKAFNAVSYSILASKLECYSWDE